jgi:hypothetical protein
LHQERDFVGRTPPILAAEREQGEVLHAQDAARFDHLAYGLDPALVTRDTRQKTLFGPASVTVHDHGDMTRNERRIGDDTGGTFK